MKEHRELITNICLFVYPFYCVHHLNHLNNATWITQVNFIFFILILPLIFIFISVCSSFPEFPQPKAKSMGYGWLGWWFQLTLNLWTKWDLLVFLSSLGFYPFFPGFLQILPSNWMETLFRNSFWLGTIKVVQTLTILIFGDSQDDNFYMY